MDRRTARIYEKSARQWTAARGPRAIADGRLGAFIRRVGRGARVADLGCGPGWYAEEMQRRGFRVAALDVAAAMLAELGQRNAAVPRLRADLAALPFAPGSLDGAWAANCYCHVPQRELALALADLQRALRPGAALELTLPRLDSFQPTARETAAGGLERRSRPGSLPGRLFIGVTRGRGRGLLVGAGFEQIRIDEIDETFWLRLRARRARTLPDLVRPGLRLLVCGLNPSLYSADAGVPFARPGNRFWPALRGAELVARERSPHDALAAGIGFTDIVKRATVSASELGRREYEHGLARVAELVRLYRPRALCFVGLEGWRRAVDGHAAPGWLPRGFAGRPAYLMPSTSGRNARVPLATLVEHLRTAAAGAPSKVTSGRKRVERIGA